MFRHPLVNGGLALTMCGLFGFVTWRTEVLTWEWFAFLAATILIGLNCLRRTPATLSDSRPWVFLLCIFSLTYFLGFEDAPANGGAKQSFAWWLIIGCHVAGDLCLIYLGKSFAVLPAWRRVKTKFLYRFVRHPVYSLYMVADLVFVSFVPSLQNLTVAVLGIAAFITRAALEERLLMNDDAYRAYVVTTPYRFFPGIY